MSGDTSEVAMLRAELEALRAAARTLERDLDQACRQSAQADVLEREDADVAARMARLEPVLDLAAVTAHVRRALASAALDASGACLIVEQLLPADVLRAAVEAAPSHVGEDGRGGPSETSVPAKAAPTYAVATWMFLNDVAKDLMAPELLARLTGSPVAVELRLSRSHLARRDAPPSTPAPRSREALSLVVVLDGAQPGRAKAFTGSAPAADPQAPIEESALEWRLGFTASDRTRTLSRRRHGDLRSWVPDA